MSGSAALVALIGILSSGEETRWLCIRAPSAGTPLSRLRTEHSKLKQNLHSHQLHFLPSAYEFQ